MASASLRKVKESSGPQTAVPWAANTRTAPKAVKPSDSVIPFNGHRLAVELKPYTVLRLRIKKGW